MKRYENNSIELFNDIREGKTEAYEFVFKTYYPRLKAYASRFIVSSENLNDILQDCFIKLWENREQLTNISISSLLFTMVRNSCLNFLRHEMVAKQCPIDDVLKTQGSESLYTLSFHNNPEEVLVCDELRKEIEDILDSLPSQSREIFKMSRTDGMKNREIAEELQISVKTVEYHIRKVLAALHGFMEKYRGHPLLILLIYEALTK